MIDFLAGAGSALDDDEENFLTAPPLFTRLFCSSLGHSSMLPQTSLLTHGEGERNRFSFSTAVLAVYINSILWKKFDEIHWILLK